MNTTVRTVGQRGKTGMSTQLVLQVMNEWMDEDREVSFHHIDMARHIGYSPTTVNNAMKNLRLSRKVTKLVRPGYPMTYRVNPSGVISRRSSKKAARVLKAAK